PYHAPPLTVVLPTAGRPQFLPRAVDSALKAAPEGDVEVIVVPNGPDKSWRMALAPFQTDRRIRVAPVARAHANVARNHGLVLARGKYIRFLDDDDYLLPAASEQILALERSGHDLCSGLL